MLENTEAPALPFDDVEQITPPNSEDLPFQEILPTLNDLKTKCLAKQQELSKEVSYPNYPYNNHVSEFLTHLDKIISGEQTSRQKFGDPKNEFDSRFFIWLNGQKVEGYQIDVQVIDNSIYETDGKTIQVKNEAYNVSITKINKQ